MEAYKKWVRDNRDYLHSLESLANGLTWLLPERFSDSEIGPEAGFVKLCVQTVISLISLVIYAVSATVGIITAVNEHIIETTPSQMHINSAMPSLFPFSLCISALKNLETLIEVAAQQYYGDDKRWNFIAITEAMKVLFRLALFKSSGYKMLLEGGETRNNEKHLDTSTSQHRADAFTKHGRHHASGYLRNINGQNQWNLEGRALSALSRFGENARMISQPTWSCRVQHQHVISRSPAKIAERPTLSTILSEHGHRGALFVTGEVLYLTRPLIYVLLIRKYGSRSWTPWFLSLAVDLIGMGFLAYVTSAGVSRKDQRFCLSDTEKDEMRRRKMLWAFYLMRDPFFDRYTRRKLERAEKALEPVPFIGFLTAKIVELIAGAQTRYTYMSAS